MPAGLVGRDAELTRLTTVLAEASGSPRLVLVDGEAGIGKTTLVSAVAEGYPDVRWAAGVADAGVPPFWLWRQLTPEVPFEALDDRFELFERVARELTGCRLVVVDDLQWTDEASLQALRHALRGRRTGPVTVIATVRSGEAPDDFMSMLTAGLPHVEHLTLYGLDEAAAAAVLRAEAGRPLSDDEVAAATAASGGNPLFLREYGRLLASRADTPGRLADVITARVRRLSPHAQELLSAGCVLADEFELPVVARLLDVPTAALLPAVDEAIGAGLLSAAGHGRFRFTHGLLRTTLETQQPLQRTVALHARAAKAIEDLHGAALGEAAAEIARHWAAVAITGERRPAVQWARRAGDEAMHAHAYEDAAAWYTSALAAGATAVDDVERAEISLAKAAAEAAAGRLAEGSDAAGAAVAAAQQAGRPDLVAAAALATEVIGDRTRDRNLREWCLAALDAVDGDALRARLLARLSEAYVYNGEVSPADDAAGQALELAERSGDDEAVITALRARQLTRSGPSDNAVRQGLAARMIGLGERLRRPDVEMWGRLWRIDTLWEQGDLSAVDAEQGRLRWCVEQQPNPIRRWHLLRSRAALAQARGEFGDAIALATEAFTLITDIGHPGGFGGYVSLVAAVQHHRGPFATPGGEGPHQPPPAPDDVRAELFGKIGPAMALVEAGQLELAEQFYLRAGPPATWDIPPYFALNAPYVAAHVARALGRTADVAWALERFAAWRGRHVVTGAGVSAYHGPVDLITGQCAATLGDLATAVTDLQAALDAARRVGAAPFAVEAAVELAAVQTALGRPSVAAALLRRARVTAQALGMTPWLARIDAASGAPADPLTAREREVAALVAKGKSNREIAGELVLSERTAANHVQHILTKLGFANRSQIAAWAAQMSSTLSNSDDDAMA